MEHGTPFIIVAVAVRSLVAAMLPRARADDASRKSNSAIHWKDSVDSCRTANDYETSCRICLRFREPQLELPGSEPWDRGRRRYARRCRTEGSRSRCLQSRGRRRCLTGGSRSRLPERRNRSKLGTPLGQERMWVGPWLKAMARSSGEGWHSPK